jgi:hypothetical protein
MIYVIISNYLILISIFGYSLFFKNKLNRTNKTIIYNLDFFYGVSFLLFLSIFLNFFSPLMYFTIPIICVGVFLFLKGLRSKNFKINFFNYFIIIFLISFIAFYGRDNVDSPMYHLQIIKWLSLHKITFGIANLEIRLGFSSSWHSLLSLLNLTFGSFSAKYYLSTVIFSVIIFEVIQKKKIKLSFLFLYIFLCYLFLFSYLHPFNNGVILNHLGNPERDLVSMFIYVFSFYIFIKIFEEQEFSEKKKNLINILNICVFFCVSIRFINLLILLLPIFVFYKNRKYKIFNIVNIFIFIIGILWLIRNFILSGCFIFPIEQTCLETNWSVSIEALQNLVNEAKRYSRTLPYLNGVEDYDYSLYSYKWLIPWIKNYLLTTALLQINLFIIVFVSASFVFKIIYFKFKNIDTKKIDHFEIMILVLIFFSILLWMVSPEIRYAWGLLFVLPCFLITLFIKNFLPNFVFKLNQKLVKSGFLIIFLLFFFKNMSLLKIEDILTVPNRSLNFSNIKKIGSFSDFDIFFNKWKCGDYEGICVNTIKENYNIEKKYSYVFFKRD